MHDTRRQRGPEEPICEYPTCQVEALAVCADCGQWFCSFHGTKQDQDEGQCWECGGNNADA